MKRILSLIIILMLLLSSVTVFADAEDLRVISCREADARYSTKIPSDAIWEYRSGGSAYVWLEEQGSVPNIWIYPRGSKLNDPVTFMHVTYPDFIADDLGDRLMSTSLMEYFEIGGRQLPAAGFIYRAPSGAIINQINMVLLLETEDVEFQVRYMNDEKDMALEALDAVIRYFRLDPDYYSGQSIPEPAPSVPEPAPSVPGPAQGGSAGAAAHSFTVTNIQQDGMLIGRCTAPAGYTVESTAYCCTNAQSASYPWLLAVFATSPDQTIHMTYSSARSFYTEPGFGTKYDGQFHPTFFTPVLHYMNAADFCDYVVADMNPAAEKIVLVDEDTYPGQQGMLRQKEQALMAQYSLASTFGLTIEKVECALSARRYRIEAKGLTYYYVVAAATTGVFHRLPYSSSTSYIIWEAPYIYTMFCPEYLWEDNAAIFPAFMENTTVNDQFLLANQRLSTEILSMMTGIDLVGAEGYSRSVMKETTSTGNDYNDERFTDYIYDQNDYTLSDGSHVKVSTQYDYVWEGDNGVVYYSDSAFAQPGGSTQLTPNR